MISYNGIMSIENQSIITIQADQAAVQIMAESFNNGIKSQGSVTPDSNGSAKDIATVEGETPSQLDISASDMERSDLEINKEEPVLVTGTVFFCEEYVELETLNVDKEVEEKILLIRSTLLKHGSCSIK